MAVPFFMLVTGYVYTKSFQGHEIETLDQAYNKNYFLKNFIRYTIPYMIMYLLEFLLKTIVYIKNPSGLKQFFISNIALFLQGGIGPGSYYYPEMIQIIFLFPVIYILIKKFNFKGVLISALITLLFEILKFPYMSNEGQYRLLLFRYFMLLAFGSYFALNKIDKKLWLASINGFIFIIVFGYIDYKPFIFKWWTGTSMFPVLFIVPIFGFLVEKQFKCTPLEIVGKASYNIFLTQMVYYWVLYGKIASFIKIILLNALLSVIICVSIGIVFYEIESRITRKITDTILEKI